MARILIVDDDLYIRDLYQEICTDAGYEVTVAVDGEEGFQKMHEGGFDVVLLDIMMPKKDGLGVLNELIVSPPVQPNKNIILLTNLAHEPVVKEALEKGAKAFLIKADITPDILLEKIKEYLNG